MKSYPDEDDRGGDCHQTIEFDQSRVFVLVSGDIKVHLFNALDGEFGLLQSNCVGVGSE